jgi:hypothetical protein
MGYGKVCLCYQIHGIVKQSKQKMERCMSGDARKDKIPLYAIVEDYPWING